MRHRLLQVTLMEVTLQAMVMVMVTPILRTIVPAARLERMVTAMPPLVMVYLILIVMIKPYTIQRDIAVLTIYRLSSNIRQQ